MLSYWVDYELGHYFPSPPGAVILAANNPDPSNVEILAAKNPDGSVVVMAVDHAVHAATDNNGQGDPRSIMLDVSAVGPFSTATLLRIDAHTDPLSGPTSTTVAITIPCQSRSTDTEWPSCSCTRKRWGSEGENTRNAICKLI